MLVANSRAQNVPVRGARLTVLLPEEGRHAVLPLQLEFFAHSRSYSISLLRQHAITRLEGEVVVKSKLSQIDLSGSGPAQLGRWLSLTDHTRKCHQSDQVRQSV